MIGRRQVLTSAVALGATAIGSPGAIGAARDDERERLIAAVDPALRPPLKGLSSLSGTPLTRSTLAAARRSINPPAPRDRPAFFKTQIGGRAGAPPVTIYVINAGSPGQRRPAILHTHGGGYVLMEAADSLPDLQGYAARHDCVIVSVDYRLAPETPFPGSLEDNYAGLLWLHRHADRLGADPARIALLGESAGGGHAAMLAIAARDRGEVAPIAQVLVFPMLDDRTGVSRVPPFPIGRMFWTPEQNRFGWSALLGQPAGLAQVPYGSVPARVTNLAGLPPAFVGVGSIDLFVEEDIDYAKRLIEAGVPTDLLVVPGAYHGFYFGSPQAPVSQRFVAAIDGALARAFHRAPAQ